MRLSIIIPTRGRNTLVGECLKSIAIMSATRDEIEVLVVDNNDEAAQSAQLESICCQAPLGVRYIVQPLPGLSAARHLGAEEAKGEILAFIDDDSLVSTHWAEAIIDAFDDQATGIVGGASIPAFQSSIPAWLWGFFTDTPFGGWQCGWLSLLDIGSDVADINPIWIWGLNFSIRRDVLFRLGGFNPDLVPKQYQRWQGDGETGLSLKAIESGVRACYVQRALVRHVIGADRLTTDYFKQRAFYQGVCDSYTKIREGNQPLAGESRPRRLPNRPAAEGLANETDKVRFLTVGAYNDGWLFHQREALNDGHLLEWIRRKDYLSADIGLESRRRVARQQK